MRYWIRPDGSDYSPSMDDMSRMGYIEVTVKPEVYSSLWDWSFDTNAWVLNTPRFIAQLAANRYQHEIAGLTIDGKTYDTDDRARVALMALITYGKPETVYKLADGSYETLTLDQIKALFDHVMDHTISCYAHEKVIREFVDEGLHTVEMLDDDWPSNVIETTPAA